MSEANTEVKAAFLHEFSETALPANTEEDCNTSWVVFHCLEWFWANIQHTETEAVCQVGVIKSDSTVKMDSVKLTILKDFTYLYR